MGSDKATIFLNGNRLIDILIDRFKPASHPVFLSSQSDFDTGIPTIVDNPSEPAGPVGAIFSIAAQLPHIDPGLSSFITVPVDAPFVPDDLIHHLVQENGCSVAKDIDRTHPTFGHWQCDAVNKIRARGEWDGSPSLHWLAKTLGAKRVNCDSPHAFFNINAPEDLRKAERVLSP